MLKAQQRLALCVNFNYSGFSSVHWETHPVESTKSSLQYRRTNVLVGWANFWLMQQRSSVYLFSQPKNFLVHTQASWSNRMGRPCKSNSLCLPLCKRYQFNIVYCRVLSRLPRVNRFRHAAHAKEPMRRSAVACDYDGTTVVGPTFAE